MPGHPQATFHRHAKPNEGRNLSGKPTPEGLGQVGWLPSRTELATAVGGLELTLGSWISSFLVNSPYARYVQQGLIRVCGALAIRDAFIVHATQMGQTF